MGLGETINKFFSQLFHTSCKQCDWYKQQYEFHKGKIERLELALFPLSTTAGVRYGAATVPGQPRDLSRFQKLDSGRPKTFAQVRQEFYANQAKEIAADEAKEAAAAKEKENVNL